MNRSAYVPGVTDAERPRLAVVAPPDWRVARPAIIAWIIFALAIAANTVMKDDELRLNDPASTTLVGKANERDSKGITFYVRGKNGQDGELKRFAWSEVGMDSPLGVKSVTGNYRLGSIRWRHGEPMYSSGPHGFLYWPQAAIAFMPFEVMPPVVGETLWRWLGMWVYVLGVWRLCRLLLGARWAHGFVIASLLAIPAALGSAQNGQTNLLLGGLLALGAVDASRQRYWFSTLWCMLALACKPVAIPVILLLGAVYPGLILPGIVGLVVFLLVPFVHVSPGHVWSEYGDAIRKTLAATDPKDYFTDIRGMLRDMGVVLTDRELLPVRGAAAVVWLGVCLWISRRVSEPSKAAYVLTLGAAYALVFNPRTEGVTHALIGPAAAVLATALIMSRRWVWGALVVAYCLVLQFSLQLTDPITGRERKYWLRPMCTLALAAGLVFAASRREPVFEDSTDGVSAG